MKKLPIHINNAMPGAPDLFIGITETVVDENTKNETLIKAGENQAVFIPEDDAIGVLVPAKKGEDPWLKMQAIFQQITSAFLDTNEGKELVQAMSDQDSETEKGSIRWLTDFLGFGYGSRKKETKPDDDLFSFESRARMAARVASQIQLDLASDNYDAEGHPNCMTMIGLLTWPREDLEKAFSEYPEDFRPYMDSEDNGQAEK